VTAAVPLLAEALVRDFRDGRALAGVDLAVRAGEIHAVVGLNGAGKSTLMKVLVGMLEPTSGRALVLGHEARAAGAGTWSRVGHLVESVFAYPELTVVENLSCAARLHGLSGLAVPEAVEAALVDLSLASLARRRAATLSLGNRQRLALAAALVHQPEVLVLDEPTNALDPVGVVDLRALLLRRAHRDGAAVLVSSHHLDEVARVADTITVLHRGSVVGGLPPGDPDLERQFFDVVYAAERSLP
jgi:ABC-2 type transport system ATP-binding protein